MKHDAIGGRQPGQLLGLTNLRLPDRPGLWALLIDQARRISDPKPLRALSREDRARLFDGAGALVVPGFHDAHMHVFAAAAAVGQLDLRELSVGNMQRLAAVIRARASEVPPGGWVHLTGFDEWTMTGGVMPDRSWLDSLQVPQPVRIQHGSTRLDIVNSAGATKLDLWDSTASGLERDTDGSFTGRVYDSGGRGLATNRLAEADRRTAVYAFSRELSRHGVTALHDAGASNDPDTVETLLSLARSGVIRQRVRVMLGADSLDLVDRSWLRRHSVLHAKLLCLEANPALDRLIDQAHRARRLGLSLALHAVSEAELAMACAVLDAAGPAPTPVPDRIEHAAVISADLITTVRALGPVVVANPAFIVERGERYLGSIEPAELASLHPVATWLKVGVPLVLASDAPVTRSRPLDLVEAAVTRRTRGGVVLGIEERITPGEAITAMTATAATVGGWSSGTGRLREGAPADLALIGGVAPDDVTGGVITATVIDGRLEYSTWTRAEPAER